MLTFFGVSAAPSIELTWQEKTQRAVRVGTIVVVSIITFTACFLCIFKYWGVSIEAVFFGLMETGATVPITYSLIIGVAFSHKFRNLFDKIQDVYDKSNIFLYKTILNCLVFHFWKTITLDKHANAFQPTTKSYQMSQKVTTFFWKYYAPGYIICYAMMSVANIVICYFLNGLTNPMCMNLAYLHV